MDHQEYQELLALHSLGALDPSEARALEEHLSVCAECRAELVEFGDAAGLLAYAATPAEPRPEVRILEGARNASQGGQPVARTSAKVVPLRPSTVARLWPNV